MEGYIGAIMLWGPNFAPRNWAFCHGQLLAISSNTALFSLIGTIYGGDGRTTFALPDLQGRVPVGPGNGPGLPNVGQGQKFGAASTTLTTAQLPSHNHTATMRAESAPGTTGNPTGNLLGVITTGADIYAPPVPAQEVSMASDSIVVNNNGGSQAFDQHQPSLGVNYIICLEGIFPSRS
ncbi:MAG: tail fiber protein [Erythrobacter sp.]